MVSKWSKYVYKSNYYINKPEEQLQYFHDQIPERPQHYLINENEVDQTGG